MRYYSTNKAAPSVGFRDATIAGQAPDKGLYFPERIPALSEHFLRNFATMPKADMAFEVMQPYLGDEIAPDDLHQLCHETLDFPFPLPRLDAQTHILELFHGPTLAFKDVGARFMSRCLGHFSKHEGRKVTVLVATSGDTGGAVAHGFLGVAGVEVIILYPSGKVSKVQEQQLTTLGKNITALEVQGTFDDCQAMVKAAFMDTNLRKKLHLTSANSINVARWLPQQLYYFLAAATLEASGVDMGSVKPVFAVPSGNFGNICAGLLAQASGLPLGRFVAACNANHPFTDYLATGVFTPTDAVPTMSNAMDVGNPSNLVRIVEIFATVTATRLGRVRSEERRVGKEC